MHNNCLTIVCENKGKYSINSSIPLNKQIDANIKINKLKIKEIVNNVLHKLN